MTKHSNLSDYGGYFCSVHHNVLVTFALFWPKYQNTAHKTKKKLFWSWFKNIHSIVACPGTLGKYITVVREQGITQLSTSWQAGSREKYFQRASELFSSTKPHPLKFSQPLKTADKPTEAISYSSHDKTTNSVLKYGTLGSFLKALHAAMLLPKNTIILVGNCALEE